MRLAAGIRRVPGVTIAGRFVVTEVEGAGRSGATGVFPFGFRGQTEFVAADPPIQFREEMLKELPVLAPEVVLMDINLPGMNGVECVRRLKELLPETQVVMLTVYENTNIIFSALASGASGYLLKQSSPEQIIEAIREVHAGGSPMTSHIARKVVASFQNISKPSHDYEKLSLREQQVIDWLAQGYTYQEIADSLKITYATVHTHIRHIYEKLHVCSRTEAVSVHLRHLKGLVQS
jgi:DNA-binding NarL/FixJ family response regulator